MSGFFAIMTQIFLFFSDFYKHSCHMLGFPLLDGDVGLIASLLFCFLSPQSDDQR